MAGPARRNSCSLLVFRAPVKEICAVAVTLYDQTRTARSCMIEGVSFLHVEGAAVALAHKVHAGGEEVYFLFGMNTLTHCTHGRKGLLAARFVAPISFFSSLTYSVSCFVYLQLRDSCTGCVPINLGTGVGYSVMEVVKGMEEASGKPIPYKVGVALWWGVALAIGWPHCAPLSIPRPVLHIFPGRVLGFFSGTFFLLFPSRFMGARPVATGLLDYAD